jgi:hypothetical protein
MAQSGGGYAGVQAQTNGKATGSLVCGIISLFCFGIILGVVAIALGVIARNEITASGGSQKGEGMALAGIILGALGAIFGIGWIVWVYT